MKKYELKKRKESHNKDNAYQNKSTYARTRYTPFLRYATNINNNETKPRLKGKKTSSEEETRLQQISYP